MLYNTKKINGTCQGAGCNNRIYEEVALGTYKRAPCIHWWIIGTNQSKRWSTRQYGGYQRWWFASFQLDFSSHHLTY